MASESGQAQVIIRPASSGLMRCVNSSHELCRDRSSSAERRHSGKRRPYQLDITRGSFRDQRVVAAAF